jgi:hypothetical protein
VPACSASVVCAGRDLGGLDAVVQGTINELIRPRPLCERCGHPVPVWIKGRKVSERRKRCLKCS